MSAQVPSGRLTSHHTDSRPLMVAAILDQMVALTSDRALWALVGRYAQCAGSTLDPDDWFPVSGEAEAARREAAAAIDLCEGCLVRSQCLELSLRHWNIGQHGVWGGMVSADRAELRSRLPFDVRQASAGQQHQRAPDLTIGGQEQQDGARHTAGGPHWSFEGAGGPRISGAAS